MDNNMTNSGVNSGQFQQSYAVACGAKRVMLQESAKFVLGRAESSDFVISSPKVSDKHCEITCSGDSWLLHNLSPDGTTLVGKTVVRNELVKLAGKAILKIGGVYVQCHTEIESAEPPIRVLRIKALFGEACSLTAESDNQPEPGSTENGQVESLVVPRSNHMDTINAHPPENVPPEMTGEINGLINNMAIEHQQLSEELRETKEALKKAVYEKNDQEIIIAELQEQLKLYEDGIASGSVIGELMENELQCSICNELMLDAITLNCSHSYCKFCLMEWKKTDRICPLCRKSISHECKTRIVDGIIERIIRKLPDDTQQRREQLAETRRGENH